MSWAEVFKINKNMKRALNEQIRDMKYHPIRVVTASGTYSPEKTGLYRVICVGAGGDGLRSCNDYSMNYSYVYTTGGSGGGVAIKDIRLTKGSSYNITVSTTASFGNEMTATPGITGYYDGWGSKSISPAGGTASGGDFNFTGEIGAEVGDTGSEYANTTGGTRGWVGDFDSGIHSNGASVGVVISDLSRRHMVSFGGLSFSYGTSILDYGAGAPAWLDKENTSMSADEIIINKGLPAAVIIIPLEMEE